MHGSLISHAFFGRILWWLAITSDTYTNSNACLLQWLDHSVCHTQLVFPFWVSILILLPITNDTGPVPLAILPSTNRCLTSSQLLTYTLIPFCKFYSSGSNIVTIQCLFALSCLRLSTQEELHNMECEHWVIFVSLPLAPEWSCLHRTFCKTLPDDMDPELKHCLQSPITKKSWIRIFTWATVSWVGSVLNTGVDCRRGGGGFPPSRCRSNKLITRWKDLDGEQAQTFVITTLQQPKKQFTAEHAHMPSLSTELSPKISSGWNPGWVSLCNDSVFNGGGICQG